MTTSDVQPIEPDTKDWTWILQRPCPDCGFDSSRPARADFGRAIRDLAAEFAHALGGEAVTRRPRPTTWSLLEYSCHVRDVHRTFAGRIDLMLAHDAPHFPNWDQDATAVEERYHEQDPATVAQELVAAAEAVAARYDAVPDDAWERTGLRSDGSAFTLDSLGRYHLHDLVHHAWDVDVR